MDKVSKGWNWRLLVFLILFCFSFDILTKGIVDKLLESRESVEIIPRVVRLHKTMNSGALWGVLRNQNTLLILINIIAIPLIFLLFTGYRNKTLLLVISLSLIIAGALGNLYDRFLYGAVRDFIDFYIINWPVFNVADSFIFIGAFLLVINVCKGVKSR